MSTGPFTSLNFGNPGDLPPDRRDPKANMQQNWGVLTRAIAATLSPATPELAGRAIVEVHQVHGPDVCVVPAGGPTPKDAAGHDVKADAIVTNDPLRLVAVRVADCTPVLIASGDGSIVAAIHAGWRGVVANIAAAAVDAMSHLGARPEEMVAAIGPCIGPEAFEVGPEVAAEFHRVFGVRTPHVRATGAGNKSLVDLKEALRDQLIAAGLSPARVDVLPHCTVRDHADFFSHRRERGVTGRMVGIIGPRG